MNMKKRFSNDGTEEMSLSGGDDDIDCRFRGGDGKKDNNVEDMMELEAPHYDDGVVELDDGGDEECSCDTSRSGMTGEKTEGSSNPTNQRWLCSVLKFMVFGILAATESNSI